MANVTTASWTDPTTNTDGSAIASGEITGYTVGVRLASGTAGTYPYSATAPATSTSELLSALTPVLPDGVALMGAVKANTATTSSAWSNEASFTLQAIPNPPANFSIA
jgi:hypothetical protein